MSNCVAELDALLQSMQELKPPGVSGPKINQITTLCTSNIKDETVLIQKVYAHFKKAPNNKKLGVLYVVDSVSRQWLDQARKSGQTVGAGAADGTFAAGVNHVTELLPSFMSDIIAAAPEEQKVKIKKLVDIWERGTTFPASMLSGFRTKLEAAAQSTTPPGSPPKQVGGFSHSAQASAAAPPDTASILANLQALANLPKTTATPPAGNIAQGGSNSNVSYPQTSFSQAANPVNMAAYSMTAAAPGAVNGPTPVNGGVLSYGGASLPQNLFSSGQANQAPNQFPRQQQQQNGQGDGMLQQQLQILSALKAQGIPEQQWPTLLQVLMTSQNTNGGNVAAAAAAAIPQQYGQNNVYGAQNGASHDSSGGYDQYVRSPPNRNRGDSRSRSPVRDRNRNRSPSGRRGSPTYGEYNGGDDHGRGGRGRSGRNNRQRSPDRYRRSPSPQQKQQQQQQQDFGPPAEKHIEFDNNVPEGSIRVLSRTLFVGGVTCSENELRQIFAKFGRVQTCIVNIDKRHAFVKMVSRKESEVAKVEMEHYKSDSMQLRTRWGVGFGPRPCCDYATGVSTIPVDNLTEADRKWMLSAEYGGTGGKAIQSRMVVEEPDIEIGAGVSSKAISRRMQTDKSGQMGPRSTREPAGRQRGGREHDNPNQTPLGNGNQRGAPGPAVPGFGMPFMQSGGLPMFQGNFSMPGQNGAQPGPPGAS